MEVVKLLKLIRHSKLRIGEHIAASFRYPFQKILSSAVEGHQALSLEDVPAANMKTGPRQGDKSTLPQADRKPFVKRGSAPNCSSHSGTTGAIPGVKGLFLYPSACSSLQSRTGL